MIKPYWMALLLVALVGCASEAPKEERLETEVTNVHDGQKYVLFPNCLKGKTIVDAGKWCVKDNYDWVVYRLEGEYEGELADVGHPPRKEGTVFLIVKDGRVTDSFAHFNALLNIKWHRDTKVEAKPADEKK